MQRFEYLKATTVEQAVSFLALRKETAKLLAGGTDLIPDLKNETLAPEYLVDIKSLPGLAGMFYDEEGLSLGALTTIRAVETSSLIQNSRPFNVLAQAARTLGSVQVRNRATIGGNLCHASPSADMAPALLALGATVYLTGPAGARSASIAEFFTGPGETVAGPDEILTEIRAPKPLSPRTAGVYIKHSPRGAMDLAVVGVAVVVSMSPGDAICADIRIGLGGVAPTPVRARQAEAVLRGRKLEDALVETAAKMAANDSSPISDVRASAEYRRAMVAVLTDRAIRQAWAAAELE